MQASFEFMIIFVENSMRTSVQGSLEDYVEDFHVHLLILLTNCPRIMSIQALSRDHTPYILSIHFALPCKETLAPAAFSFPCRGSLEKGKAPLLAFPPLIYSRATP